MHLVLCAGRSKDAALCLVSEKGWFVVRTALDVANVAKTSDAQCNVAYITEVPPAQHKCKFTTVTQHAIPLLAQLEPRDWEVVVHEVLNQQTLKTFGILMPLLDFVSCCNPQLIARYSELSGHNPLCHRGSNGSDCCLSVYQAA